MLAAAGAPTRSWRGRKAEVTPLVEGAGAAPGATSASALQVTLPEGLHTQSNKPRDPTLIPTDARRSTPRPASRSTEIVWPAADRSRSRPAATSRSPSSSASSCIGVRLTLAAGVRDRATSTVPARLRYQACDENAVLRARHRRPCSGPFTSCPQRRAANADPARATRLRAITFGTRREAAGRRTPPAPTATQRRAVTARAGRGRDARRLHRSRHRPAATWARADFLDVHPQRRSGRPGRGACSRGAARSPSCCSCSSAASRST